MATEYIAATIPAKTDRVSNTTLFHVAMKEFGDPLQWVPIAQLNRIADPWILPLVNVLIPPVIANGSPTGILTPTGTLSYGGLPGLDFANPADSGFIVLLEDI